MHSLLAAAEATESEGSLLLPPLYEIFWAALVLLVIVLIVGRYGLPKIYGALDERAQRIEEGLAAADKALEDSAATEREREAILREAHAEAHALREKATEEAKGIVASAREEAQAEAARILDGAQRQILAEKQAAEISLRSDVGLLATELAERIVGEHLKDTALTSRVVDRFLDELESQAEIGVGEKA